MTSSGTVTGSDLIAKALELEGVRTVFTLAGDHILPALDVMADGDFSFIDTRHEQAAVHMADAWGRITGQPGVAMYTTPGFANAVPGLANAMHSGSPLLSISGCAEFSELGRGAMQEIDQVGMALPTTKAAAMVTDARRIPDMISTALRVAYEGRRGPVHLTIPVDIQQESVPADEVAFYTPSEYRDIGAPAASAERVREAVDILHAAERPLIIVGSAGAYARSGETLEKLVETTRIPIMTEGDARGLISDAHPYCYGFFDSGLNRAARLVRQADAVVLMGRKQDLILGYAMPPTIAPDAKIIQIDPSAAEIARNRGVAVGIHGDVDAVARQMIKEAAKREWRDLAWLSRWKRSAKRSAKNWKNWRRARRRRRRCTRRSFTRLRVGTYDTTILFPTTAATSAISDGRTTLRCLPRRGGTCRRSVCWGRRFRRPSRLRRRTRNGARSCSQATARSDSTAWSTTPPFATTCPSSA